MRITHNLSAMLAFRQINVNNNKTTKAIEKLTSGLRINRAGDDAAGLSISEKMRAQTRGLSMAMKNALDGISLIQTAEGAMNEQHSILQRIRELAVQAGNDTYTSDDRNKISTEVSSLINELDNIINSAEFNSKKLLKGPDNKATAFQIGANADQKLNLLIKKSWLPSYAYFAAKVPFLITGAPSDDTFIDLSSTTNANKFLSVVDRSIRNVSGQRANLGSMQNRLEHTLANLQTAAENLTAAESRIRDTDLATMTMEYTKQQILGQAATAMLAQANQLPRGILQLIQ